MNKKTFIWRKERRRGKLEKRIKYSLNQSLIPDRKMATRNRGKSTDYIPLQEKDSFSAFFARRGHTIRVKFQIVTMLWFIAKLSEP